jgi:thiamine-monophosphate kinase
MDWPQPRVALGVALRGAATAAIDVSDGLLGDLGKLCAASGVGARLDLECLPVSQELRRRCAVEECEQFVLGGGDDYELLFTVPGHEARALEQALADRHPLTLIGQVEAAPGVRCMRGGRPVEVRGAGYDHFA